MGSLDFSPPPHVPEVMRWKEESSPRGKITFYSVDAQMHRPHPLPRPSHRRVSWPEQAACQT